MYRRWIPLLALVTGLVVTLSAWTAQADVTGRCRITQLNGRVVTGDVKELADAYEVTVRPGMVITIRKSEVYKVEPLETEVESGAGAATGASVRRRITDQEIQDILGSEDLDELMADRDPPDELMTPLDTNQDGRREMLRITGGGQVWETPHFLFVYTSDTKLARELGGRLESVYRWCVKFMEMLEIPFKRPENKLEVYFFETFDEYNGYQTNVGFDSMGAIGFYYRLNNRCAFFDMHTWPPIARYREMLEDPSVDYRRRRYITNRIKRWVAHMNREVIQHEAGHHIHFNIGIFNQRSDVNTWLVEGLTQQFETPPGKLGASLGATNHYRLNQFRQVLGYPTRRFPDLRMFILDNSQWKGANSYPLGWALVHYLWKKKRDGLGQYMRTIAAWEDDVTHSMTEKQQLFEDCFGRIDEDWEKEFLAYINGIQLRRSALPLGDSP